MPPLTISSPPPPPPPRTCCVQASAIANLELGVKLLKCMMAEPAPNEATNMEWIECYKENNVSGISALASTSLTTLFPEDNPTLLCTIFQMPGCVTPRSECDCFVKHKADFDKICTAESIEMKTCDEMSATSGLGSARAREAAVFLGFLNIFRKQTPFLSLAPFSG